MKSKLTKWGNSLGLRIPQAIVEMLNLENGSQVEMRFHENSLVISPIDPNFADEHEFVGEINIEKLSKQITSANSHNYEEDSVLGDEVW